MVGSSGSNQAGVIWVPRGYLAMFGDIFALVVITAGVATSMWCGESRADVVNMHQGTEQLPLSPPSLPGAGPCPGHRAG